MLVNAELGIEMSESEVGEMTALVKEKGMELKRDITRDEYRELAQSLKK